MNRHLTLATPPEDATTLGVFRDLLFFSPDVICSFDEEGRFLYASAAAATVWGYAPGELLGKPYQDFVVAEDHASTAAAAVTVRKAGELVDFENHYTCKDGRVVPMVWRVRWDPEKRIVYAAGRDITERKATAQQLARQEKKLRRGYALGQLAWWEYTVVSQTFHCADEVFHLCGLPVPENRAISLNEVVSLLHPDDRDRVAKDLAQLEQPPSLSRRSTAFRYRNRLVKPCGGLVTMLHAAEVEFDNAGRVAGLHGTVKDISNSYYHRQLERLERKILEMHALPNTRPEEMLAVYMRGIEALHYGLYCSIMELREGRLYNLASPSLPAAYLSAIEGKAAGPLAGSCGTAAFLKEKVIVPDVRTDERWAPFRGVAVEHGLLACWSVPILDLDNTVMATFGCYYRQPRAPSPPEENTIRRTGYLLTIIFENYRRAQALQESHLRYEMVTRASHDALWDRDLVRDVARWSEGFFTLFGYDGKGRRLSMAEIFQLVHPDDAARVGESVARALDSREDTWREEYRLRRADGRYAYVADRAFILRDETGKAIRMVGAVQDITARKEAEHALRLSEAQYRLLFYQNPVPKLIFAADTFRIVQVNDLALTLYGYSRESFLTLSMRDILCAEEADLLQSAGWSAAPGAAVGGTLSCHRKKDGTTFYADMYRQPLQLPAGLHYLVSVTDMTEKLRLQQELIDEKVAAQQALARVIIDTQEKERSVIGKELHDNVNQLLTTVKLYVENMRHFPEQAPAFADKGVALVLRAIDAIRLLSRQLVTPAIEDLGLEASLAELVDQYRVLKLFRVELQTEFREEDLPPALKLTLYRIVQEQLTNIVKYAGATEVQVILLQNENEVRLQVSDNGVGFDPAASGAGLGLRNMRSRAEAYQGRMVIETAPGKGCTVVAQFKWTNA